MLAGVGRSVVLENELVRAELVPEQGGRLRSLYDRVGGRELLYARPGAAWDADDYLATLAGGWDQMFPNDDPWHGLPTHGTLWSAELEVVEASPGSAALRVDLPRPDLTVTHRYTLLEPPRRGVRLETEANARETLSGILWATHPMLAVEPGWRIDPGTAAVDADANDPGRAAPGRLDAATLDRVLTLPEPSLGWQEILYAPAAGVATVSSPEGTAATRVTWDREFFPWLWLVTLSGFVSVDLALVVEPCTTRPYRLDEAVAEGTAAQLVRGSTYRFWSCVEAV
ncbi:MAG TPA: hypothetical protein VGC78_05595 [Gaiellaceae bacterium]